jgi:hypothetical protein
VHRAIAKSAKPKMPLKRFAAIRSRAAFPDSGRDREVAGLAIVLGVWFVWKIDRFGRSLKHLVNALADL